MDELIKKKLARNWFKTLQEVICQEIEELEGKKNIFKFKNGDTLLFGRESSGVPQKVHKIMRHRIKIPMIEKKRSLNLASSVAIILSENIRQPNYLWTN